MENVSSNPLEVTTPLVNEHVRDPSQQRKLIVYSRRKGPKTKRLNEVVDNSVASTINQAEETRKYEQHGTTSFANNEGSSRINKANVGVNSSAAKTQSKKKRPSSQHPTPLPMPEKEILEFVLDKLQKQDTKNLFAGPVDINEAVGYYHLIENPMDFTILRKNLAESVYKSLDHFENDVLAIFQNAMKYNATYFNYFRQARHICERAKSYFRELKTEPSKVIKEFLEANKTSRHKGTKPLISIPRQSESETETELSESDSEERNTYKPQFSASGAEEEQLIPGNGGVRESPALFSEGSGKTAGRVACQEMSFPSGTSSENFLGLAEPQPQPQPASNRRILNTVARRGNNLQIQEVVNPSHIPPRAGTFLAPWLSVSANSDSPNYQNQSSTYVSDHGYQGSSSLTTDARGKQMVQLQPTSFPSAARSSLQNFLSRDRRQAKAAAVQAQPRLSNPSRLSQCSALPLEASSNSPFHLAEKTGNEMLVLQHSQTPVSEPVNNRSYEDEITTLWPKNQDGTLLSFTELLLNQAGRDEVALLQETQQSFSSAMEPRCNTASTMENSSTLPPNDQTEKSFSFTEFLFDEGDGSAYQEAFTEWMNSR